MSDVAGAGAERWIELEWSTKDEMLWVTLAGTLGLILAGAMALFGLPPIDLHGPLHRWGVMDPLCGGTRAARLTAQGHLGAAWTYNPLGIIATLAALAAVLRVAIGATTRRWLNIHLIWSPRMRLIALVVVTVLAVALEIRQQGRSELLTKPY